MNSWMDRWEERRRCKEVREAQTGWAPTQAECNSCANFTLKRTLCIWQSEHFRIFYLQTCLCLGISAHQPVKGKIAMWIEFSGMNLNKEGRRWHVCYLNTHFTIQQSLKLDDLQVSFSLLTLCDIYDYQNLDIQFYISQYLQYNLKSNIICGTSVYMSKSFTARNVWPCSTSLKTFSEAQKWQSH